jgi:hypothetical protein
MAFMSYVVLVVAWGAIAFRINRNQQLLRNLEKLPPDDRLPALQLEVNGVQLRSGISPEQWIRSRIHQYLFLGFAALCLVGVLLFIISGSVEPWKPHPGLREVYIHYGNNRGQAATLQRNLIAKHVSVPGLIPVPSNTSQDIRYANDRDMPIAVDLQGYLMRDEGIDIPNLINLRDKGVPGVPGRVEIWLK